MKRDTGDFWSVSAKLKVQVEDVKCSGLVLNLGFSCCVALRLTGFYKQVGEPENLRNGKIVIITTRQGKTPDIS